MATAHHIIYRLLAEDELVWVDEFSTDPTSYQLLTPVTLVAERVLTDWFDNVKHGPGRFRIKVSGYGGTEIVTVDRPMPLPEKWAELRMHGGPSYLRPSKLFADKVLKIYPGTDVGMVGEHLELFGDHYHGKITTAELAARTGYQLPENTYRPHYPPTDIDPATDLAVVSTDEKGTDR